MSILPNTTWQHITFTMPGELWDIFELNRHLLKQLSPYAANAIKEIANAKGILPGMFAALHTFGRDLKWNTHVHLSVTLGGLTLNNEWKKITFSYHQLMPLWRYAVIQLLKDHFHELKLPEHIERVCPDKEYWLRWLDKHYQKNWMVHFSNPDSNHHRNVKYIGSYVKRPPLAMSRLKHYNGHEVVYEYFDHKTKSKQTMALEGEIFIERFVKHVPEKHFRMINYYGFLANRVRTEKLKLVYALLGQEDKDSKPISYRQLLIKTFGTDPLECILCGTKMVLAKIAVGLNLTNLSKRHRELALSKIFDVTYTGVVRP